jgi:CHAD domain-containing protein
VQGRLARNRCPDREAWTAVKQHLQERRSESFSRATRKLNKVNMAVFYTRAKAMLDRLKPAPHQDHGSHSLVQPDRPALEPFPTRLTQALAGAWREFEKQVASSHKEMTAPSIHAARLCAKRLRYLLEVANQFRIPGSSGALTWLRKIQDNLGYWHDMEVLEEMIIEMMAEPEFLRDQLPLAMATGKLILRNRTTKRGFREKYFHMTLDSPEYQGFKNWAGGLLAAPASALASA